MTSMATMIQVFMVQIPDWSMKATQFLQEASPVVLLSLFLSSCLVLAVLVTSFLTRLDAVPTIAIAPSLHIILNSAHVFPL